MPFTELKIDRSFICEMDTSEEALTIVRSIISLGRNLEMDVCAEGVESLAISQALGDLGCDFGQGYYYCKPQPPDIVSQSFVVSGA